MNKLSFLLGLLLFQLNGMAQKSNDGWKNIFNQRNLKGWMTANDQPRFSVQQGQLICSTANAALIYTEDKPFRNFEWLAELKTDEQCHASILFHASRQPKNPQNKGYEVLINNNHYTVSNHGEARKTGSLAAIRDIYYPTASNGNWFSLRIKVVENHIQVFVNDHQVVDYIQPEHPWRNDQLQNRILGDGYFVIRTNDSKNSLHIKSIQVKRLEDATPSVLRVSPEWDEKLTKLMSEGFPLIDYHVHLKGGLTLEQVMENSRRLGINYGVAPNCGLHFPVTNDSSLAKYMDTVKGQPIFRGMQAEGREWISLFSPQAIATFDYAFTDAMTFTDSKGRRNRIWIPEETWVDDKQPFMDQMVQKIESIFSQEPVDIYVNPTNLPVGLMPEYDQLWTKERMEKVVKVIAANNIAMEINSRYQIPSPAFIKMAKRAGVKFTFGTNNAGNDLGQLDYSIKMIQECGIKPSDMFFPKEGTQKPVFKKGLPKKITG